MHNVHDVLARRSTLVIDKMWKLRENKDK